MISKLHLYSARVKSSIIVRSAAQRRLYSTASASSSYESFDDNIFYTPIRKVNFESGRAIIYNQTSNPGEVRYVPWEVKETTIKNFMGVMGFVILDYLFAPVKAVYTLGAMSFGLNWMYRVYGYLGNAIVKIEVNV